MRVKSKRGQNRPAPVSNFAARLEPGALTFFSRVSLMPYEIDGEAAYPIYPVRFRFHHSIKDPEKVKDYGPSWFEGLPEGRIWGGASLDYMVKADMADAEIIEFLGQRNLDAYLRDYPDLDGWQVSVKPPRIETWTLKWFNHFTIDRGQDDLAVLASFERFVNRTQRLIDGGDKTRCLMGAEDRWRWRGEKEGDTAPCRCDGCKRNGVIGINH